MPVRWLSPGACPTAAESRLGQAGSAHRQRQIASEGNTKITGNDSCLVSVGITPNLVKVLRQISTVLDLANPEVPFIFKIY